MKKSLLVLAAAIAAAVSMNATAAISSTINFQGSVINGTCEIATVSENQTVILPQVTSSSFTGANQPGDASTIAPFQITLTGCDASVPGTVAVAFDATPVAGFDDVIENNGTATGVGVRIHDSQSKAIAFTGAILDHATTPVALANGDMVFNLDAEYYSTTATVTAGTVLATAVFEVIYP